MTDNSRAEFEEVNKNCNLDRDMEGDYKDFSTHYKYEGWILHETIAKAREAELIDAVCELMEYVSDKNLVKAAKKSKYLQNCGNMAERAIKQALSHKESK